MAMTYTNRQSIAQDAESQTADFEMIFQSNWERLCRLLYTMLGDMDEAQDLALEAFMQLYRRPPAESSNLNGWLYRVASNLGYNALRARKRRQRYELQAGKQAFESTPVDDPAVSVERLEELRRVRAALSTMKPRDAKILLLRHSGFSYREIAAIVDVAASSVGKLITRAERAFESKYLDLSKD
jgi:RNA polymerase sigma-70 factor (ECF subfamily)